MAYSSALFEHQEEELLAELPLVLRRELGPDLGGVRDL
jgi:hypothetical protein